MPAEPAEISRRVVEHFRAHRRDLPWRRTRDPYAIWVSEIMLQQTRVAAVVPYYERWMERFPTVERLAEAPRDDVLAHWSGLGYYRRARALHEGAREVVERYGGDVPSDASELRSLPGIGPYTAGAIASLAFGRPEPVVDGNVIRVLARLYEVEGEVGSGPMTREIWRLAGELVPEEAPGDFNQGLMEIGATVCTPTGPACLLCPLSEPCRARASGRQEELPRARRRKRPEEKPLIEAAAAWIRRRGRVLVGRRAPDGLYGGLWELPQAPSRRELRAGFERRLQLARGEPPVVHYGELTHRRLEIHVWPGRLRGRLADLAALGYDRVEWQPLESIGDLALSSATRAIVGRFLEYEV